MALQQGRVDPQADAEVLLWDISIADQAVNNQYPSTVYTFYVRMKIFTDRGATTFREPQIEYSRNQSVSDVGGRTIQPDGSVQEISKSEIMPHVLQKRKGRKDMGISLALPKAQKGTIIEYRWRESHEDELADYVQLPAGREIPVDHVVYHIRPLVSPYFPYQMGYMGVNTKVPPFKAEPSGYFTSGLDNIPAFREEEDGPPELDVLPWVLIYYREKVTQSPEQYWKAEGKRLYAFYKDQIKVNGQVKAIAEEVTSGSHNPQEQVDRLYAYCQKIKNVNGPDVTDAERQKAKLNKNSVDTLERKIGSSADIQIAFAALARAIGVESRMSLVADREFKFFDPNMPMRYFLPARDVALQFGDKWKLYDVATRYLSPGELRWQEQGVPALIVDGKDPQWITTPVTDPGVSKVTRTAKLTLKEDGSLMGEITESIAGNRAAEWRARNWERSEAQRQETFKKGLHQRFEGAEISDIEIPDPSNLSDPLVLRCRVKIDGFALRTGKRLIFAPAFFEVNASPRYASTARNNDLYFHYPWTETDDVQIILPNGFALDHADAPGPLKFPPVAAYDVKIRAGERFISYHRELAFGLKDRPTLLSKAGYPAVKKFFDTVRDRDGHMLTLKAAETTAEMEAPKQ